MGRALLMRFTFTKADRIRTAQQYRALSQYGKRYYHSYFIIVWQLGQASRCRLGITVSKKVGKAVTRNRIKRIIREFFRLNKHALPDTLEMNIIARKASGKAENAAIREQLGIWISTINDTRQK